MNQIRDESDYAEAGGSSGSVTGAAEVGTVSVEELITKAR